MTAADVRTHIRYSGWASRRLLQVALALTDEDLSRDMSVSHKSILNTLGHIHFADRIWFSRVVDPAIEVYRSGLPPEGSLEEKWSEVQKRWEDWADSLSDADLERVVSYTSTEGKPFQTPLFVQAAHNADLLVHEASFLADEEERARETMHSTAADAAEVARLAEVRMLALIHISPRYFGPELAAGSMRPTLRAGCCT